MHPRINDGVYEWRPVEWRPATVTKGVAGSNPYALQVERYGAHVPYTDLSNIICKWVLSKEDAPVEKEVNVNVDDWKEVFATSAAGS